MIEGSSEVTSILDDWLLAILLALSEIVLGEIDLSIIWPVLLVVLNEKPAVEAVVGGALTPLTLKLIMVAGGTGEERYPSKITLRVSVVSP